MQNVDFSVELCDFVYCSRSYKQRTCSDNLHLSVVRRSPLEVLPNEVKSNLGGLKKLMRSRL